MACQSCLPGDRTSYLRSAWNRHLLASCAFANLRIECDLLQQVFECTLIRADAWPASVNGYRVPSGATGCRSAGGGCPGRSVWTHHAILPKPVSTGLSYVIICFSKRHLLTVPSTRPPNAGRPIRFLTSGMSVEWSIVGGSACYLAAYRLAPVDGTAGSISGVRRSNCSDESTLHTTLRQSTLLSAPALWPVSTSDSCSF